MRRLSAVIALFLACVPGSAQVRLGSVSRAGPPATTVSPAPALAVSALRISPLVRVPALIAAPGASRPAALVSAPPPERPGSAGVAQARAAAGARFDGTAKLGAAADADAPVIAGPVPEERRSSGLSPPTRAQVEAAYHAARPGLSAPRALRGAGADFTAFAARLVHLWTFVGKRALREMFGPEGFALAFEPAAVAAGAEILDAAAGPRARSFLEGLGRWQARGEAPRALAFPRWGPQPRHLPENPLGEGDYWDMASGMNAGNMIRAELEPRTTYSFFDMSPFVTSYLRETADIAGARNVKIMEGDLRSLRKPRRPLAVLRTKNAVAYVPGFEKKLEEMSGWIAPGGRLVVQNDPLRGQRELIVEKHGALLRRLLEEGWGFEFSFAGARRAGQELDALIFTRPQGAFLRRSPEQAEEAWREYRSAAVRAGS